MRFLLFSISILLLSHSAQAQFRCQDQKNSFKQQSVAALKSIDNSAKSDTIDILNYDINLDFSTLPQRYLEGHCDIQFTPKMNQVNSINLDLLELQIDSITMANSSLSYVYNDTIIKVSFNSAMNIGDTNTLKVYYHGAPQGDHSNWGGWHSQNGYYYNLGVGFAANPHTYGRAWFPCFDNFVEKTSYDFHITTVSPLRPYCNGIRQSETVINGDTILTHWEHTEPTPTYLASVAISNYTELNDTVAAMNGVLPIQLMAKPQDSLKMYNSFVNLKPTLHSLEAAFGPYHWSKVGYATTTVGAMEHASSIHFPTNLVDGTLIGEDILAHELAHHWWGNLLTCQTDADMWINEGMAEYSSHLYLEQVYNRERYLDAVLANAYLVLDQAHLRDDGYKSIHGLDHEYVYGTHVYQKGAMVGHNLRAYLGDNLFFSGLTSVLNANMYGNITSNDFRDQLTQTTGYNLNDFFTNWVFNAGFPQFSVDSLFTNGNTTTVLVNQRLHEAQALYNGAPISVTFFSSTGDTTSRTIIMNSAAKTSTFSLPFQPEFALTAYDGVLLSADTYDEYEIVQNGPLGGSFSKMNVSASNVSDTSDLIVMHHWAGSEGKIPASSDYRISSKRYWTVRGINLDKVNLNARINFSGSPKGLDYDLTKNGADSIVLLYRQDATHEWTFFQNHKKTQIGSTGFIEVSGLVEGEYTLANSSQKVSVKEYNKGHGSFEVYPNPARGKIQIIFAEAPTRDIEIQLIDMSGKEVRREQVRKSKSEISLNLKGIKGDYILVNVDGESRKVVLK